MLIEIKSWRTGAVLFTGEYDDISIALQKAIEINANLTNANLRYADLMNADLRYANLTNADLRYANLMNADLRYANLTNANLMNANLTNANLMNADFMNADLMNADLRYANLMNADLRYANLMNADFMNADLMNADGLEKYSYFSISPIGSENGQLWVMRNEEGILIYNRGCFKGTEEEFIAAVRHKHAGNKYEAQYIKAVELIRLVAERNLDNAKQSSQKD